MKSLRKLNLLVVFSLFFYLVSSAQQTAQKFVQELRYLLYLPDNYQTDTSTKWPLMLFLHGSGESGLDLEKVKVHGPPKLIEAGKKFPMIVVSPQATNGWRTDQLMGLVNDLKAKYRIDNERLYVTGLSMGGYGTWALASDYPGEFAAIAPICGAGDTTKAWTFRNTPVWNFHGQKDPVVPIQGSIEMVDAIKRVNPNVQFTVYPEAGHDSWTETYNNQALYTWMMAQRKFHYKEAASPRQLERLAGKYLSPFNDTVNVMLNAGSLQVIDKNGRSRALKYLQPDRFYFDENSQEDARFMFDKNGKVEAMEIWGRRKSRYVRLK